MRLNYCHFPSPSGSRARARWSVQWRMTNLAQPPGPYLSRQQLQGLATTRSASTRNENMGEHQLSVAHAQTPSLLHWPGECHRTCQPGPKTIMLIIVLECIIAESAAPSAAPTDPFSDKGERDEVGGVQCMPDALHLIFLFNLLSSCSEMQSTTSSNPIQVTWNQYFKLRWAVSGPMRGYPWQPVSMSDLCELLLVVLFAVNDGGEDDWSRSWKNVYFCAMGYWAIIES